MRDEKQLAEIRAQAIALRQAGRSLREIKASTGIRSNEFLADALRGVPPAEWTKRPTAKDDLRARARELRATGMAYNDIVRELGVSKSSVSLWVRDMPRMSDEQLRQLKSANSKKFWASEQPRRAIARRATVASAAAEIGALSDREILIAGAVAYWCEGSKSKPHRRQERVVFSNSDPRLIRLFLTFLTVAGTDRADLTCRLYIHENADLEAAERYWQETTGLPADQFRSAVLKPVRPTTVRRNTGSSYHGCLAVTVARSQDLYWRIAGWAAACLDDDAQLRTEALRSAISARRSPGSVPAALRQQAVDLRQAGHSIRQIKLLLGIRSNETLSIALRGVPPPEWNRSPSYERTRTAAAAGMARYRERLRADRADRLLRIAVSAADQIGRLGTRELMIAGAIAYWCEGGKSKSYRQQYNVVFINSDPQLVHLFRRFLASAGIANDRLVARVHIHESADIAAAQESWLALTGLPAAQFRQPTLKRHVPRTTWPAQQPDYRGCLIISVLRSSALCRQIEGWATAAMSAGR